MQEKERWSGNTDIGRQQTDESRQTKQNKHKSGDMCG